MPAREYNINGHILTLTEEELYRYEVGIKCFKKAKERHEQAGLAEKSLREFVKLAWPVAEPSPMVSGWGMDAVCDHLQAVSAGHIKQLIVNVPPRTSKPVWEEELLLEKLRGRVRLADIRVGDQVLTHRGRFRRVLAVYEQGELPLLRVETSAGRYAKTAYDHPYLTTRGWIQAGELKENDFLAAVRPAEITPDSVAKVEPAGTGRCRCLEVEEDHSFTVNDLAVHNSLICSVFWNAWEWISKPHLRWFYLSYAADRSVDDAVKCRRLIQSPWYQSNWGDRYHLTSEQNAKERYTNDKLGQRISSSVTGMGTGIGGERIVCLPYGTLITTSLGKIPIGRICDERLPVLILSYDHERRSPRWSAIEAYETNEGQPTVRVSLADGRYLFPTTDHQVFSDRGYVKAELLGVGDWLLDENSQAAPVRSVSPAETPDRVFNLRVRSDHNYFANGLLVHNCDDPNSAQGADSDAKREFVNKWWDGTMSTRSNDPKNRVRVIIQQRLHEQDLTGHVLEKGTGWVHLMLPMRFESQRKCITYVDKKVFFFEDPRKVDGELLSPERFGEAEVKEIETELGSYGAAGQLQQRPAPAGGGMLKVQWWNYWQPKGARMPKVRIRMEDGTFEEREAIELPAKFDQQLQSWDLSFKDKENSDFVAGLVIAAAGADRFILDSEHGQWGLPETLDAVRRLSYRNPNATMKLVEDKANGPAVIQSLRHEMGGFIEVNPQGNKMSRASGASPQLEAGNWYLPHPKLAPWVGDPALSSPGKLLGEMGVFPLGKNDDIVDAFSQAAVRLLHFTGPKQKPQYIREAPSRAVGSDRGWMIR